MSTLNNTGVFNGGGGAGAGSGGSRGGNGGAGGGGGGASGGGVGGMGFSGSARNGGTGGYGIQNLGTIQTLKNLQGQSLTPININGTSVITIPLYITGALPNTYSMIVDDSTGRYGQSYGKSVTGTPVFRIDDSSDINISTVGSTKTYTNIMSGFTFSNSSGTFTKGFKNFSWTIIGTNLTVRLDSIFCYNKDTTVLCLVDNIDKYIPIQDLVPGQLIKTYKHGYLPLKYLLEQKNTMMGKDRFNSMYLIKKFGSMTHDLILTGKHNILVDSIDPKYKIKYNFYNSSNNCIDDKICLLCSHYKSPKDKNARIL